MVSVDIKNSELRKHKKRLLDDKKINIDIDSEPKAIQDMWKEYINSRLDNAEKTINNSEIGLTNIWLNKVHAKVVEYSFYQEEKNKLENSRKKNIFKNSRERNRLAKLSFCDAQIVAIKEAIKVSLDGEIADIQSKYSLSEKTRERMEQTLSSIKSLDGYNDISNILDHKIEKINQLIREKKESEQENNIKPGEYVAEPKVDIYKLPTVSETHLTRPGTEITLGDLHANSVKLLYTLVHHGFVQMGNDTDYDEFVALFKKSMNIDHHAQYIKALESKENQINELEAEIRKIKEKVGEISVKDAQTIASNEKNIAYNKEDIIKLNQRYEKVKEPPFTKHDVDKINEIIERIKVAHNVGKLRLIGDELSDRGFNDYFTLKLLEKLNTGKVPLEIMMSNHSIEFLRTYEADNPYSDTLTRGQSRSAVGLQYLLDNGFVKKDAIKEIVEDSYKPNLKAVSYTLTDNNQKITIHTHAPIDVNIIKKMAEQLDVRYEFNGDVSKLAETIDRINKKLEKDYINKNSLKSLVERTEDAMTGDGKTKVREDDVPINPLLAAMWNRSYEGNSKYTDKNNNPHPALILERKNKNISYDNGHDPNDPHMFDLNISNIDNVHGKLGFDDKTETWIHNNIGVHFVHFINTTDPSPTLDIKPAALQALITSLNDYVQGIGNTLSPLKEADQPHIATIGAYLENINNLDTSNELDAYNKLSYLTGCIAKTYFPGQGEEKIIKLSFDQVARGKEMTFANFKDATESNENSLENNDLAQHAEMAPEEAVVAEPAEAINPQPEQAKLQTTASETEAPKGFLEKVKSMLSFYSKIQVRNEKKKEANQKVRDSLKQVHDSFSIEELKNQNYSDFDSLDIFNECATREGQVLLHVNKLKKEEPKEDKVLEKFIKQEIRKVEKEVHNASRKRIHAEIKFIGDKTESFLDSVNKIDSSGNNPISLKELINLKEQVKTNHEKYNELTKVDERKRNFAIEANFDDLNVHINNLERCFNPETKIDKGAKPLLQERSKRAFPIVSAFLERYKSKTAEKTHRTQKNPSTPKMK